MGRLNQTWDATGRFWFAPIASPVFQSKIGNRQSAITRILLVTLLLALASGCTHRVKYYRPAEQITITRDVVEFPAHTRMVVLAEGLTAPTCFCFDIDRNIMFVCEGGDRDGDPHI